MQQEVRDYATRLEAVQAGFALLGRGAQQQAAFDLRIAPSMVSSLINFKYVSDEKLGELEVWLADKLEAKLTPPDGEEVTGAHTGIS